MYNAEREIGASFRSRCLTLPGAIGESYLSVKTAVNGIPIKHRLIHPRTYGETLGLAPVEEIRTSEVSN